VALYGAVPARAGRGESPERESLSEVRDERARNSDRDITGFLANAHTMILHADQALLAGAALQLVLTCKRQRIDNVIADRAEDYNQDEECYERLTRTLDAGTEQLNLNSLLVLWVPHPVEELLQLLLALHHFAIHAEEDVTDLHSRLVRR
jgi:hypothetical protein